MNICIFDTETTSLDKPFCYNIGYVIADTESGEVLLRRSYVVEQVWHNLMLFSSAYYSDKRPLYVADMKAHRTIMDKYGYICQQMIRDFKSYGIEYAYAYNSPFDEKVFAFNCEWYKCGNPFDTVKILDIRGFAHHFICNTKEYKNFCESNSEFTESGNYSTTAQSVFRYCFEEYDFNEEHTALADSEIEFAILQMCLENGAMPTREYAPLRSLERVIVRPLTIKKDGKTILETDYTAIRINKDKTEIKLKGEKG